MFNDFTRALQDERAIRALERIADALEKDQPQYGVWQWDRTTPTWPSTWQVEKPRKKKVSLGDLDKAYEGWFFTTPTTTDTEI